MIIINRKIRQLISDLEYQIGKECYNPRTYNGYTEEHGCDYRYKISIPITKEKYERILNKASKDFKNNGIKLKFYEPDNNYYIQIKSNINNIMRLNQNDVHNMKYFIGANELYIGRGIVNVLNFLEDRYNISFNELEEELKSQKNRG